MIFAGIITQGSGTLGCHRRRAICFLRCAEIRTLAEIHYPVTEEGDRDAGHRVRMAEVVVELLGRQSIRVIRTTFDMLTFDDEGCFDSSAFDRHQRARVELALCLCPVGRSRVWNRVAPIECLNVCLWSAL